MNASLVLDPLVPSFLIIGVAIAALGLCAFAGWLRSPAWMLRAMGFAVLLAALANPALLRETRRALSDIALIVVDESESQRIGERTSQAKEAEADIEAQLKALAISDPNIRWKPVSSGCGMKAGR